MGGRWDDGETEVRSDVTATPEKEERDSKRNHHGEPLKPEDYWFVRRRTVFTVLGFCAAIIIWMIWKGGDTKIHEVIVDGVITIAIVTISAFLGVEGLIGYMSKERSRSGRR